MSASSPPPSSVSVTGEPGPDYFATATHYRAVAGRVLSALQGGRLVVVIGERLSLPSMSAALRQAADRRFTVIEVTGEREMAQPTAGFVPPLFLFEEADWLTGDQIDRICEVVAEGAASGTAGVLLARSGFVDRLEQSSFQSSRDAVAALLRFDELDESETIDFLRHQLETRPRDGEQRDRRPILRRRFIGLAILLLAALGALLAVRGFEQASRRNPAPSNGAYVTTPPAPAERSKAAAPAPASPQSTTPAAAAPPSTAPALPQSTTPALAAPPSTGAASAPPQPSAAQRPAAPEIAALVARGDAALTSGDIASARLFYERAAEAGNAAAALRLGATYDPGFLGRAGVRGTPGDPKQAAFWYGRARDLGDAAAAERLNSLGRAAR